MVFVRVRKRTGIDPRRVAAEVTGLWNKAKSGQEFAASLQPFAVDRMADARAGQRFDPDPGGAPADERQG